jgi:hypothetical protein
MHDGYLPGELVAQLKCCVLPAINFLLAHGAYTALYRAHEIAVAEQMASEATMRNTMNTRMLPNGYELPAVAPTLRAEHGSSQMVSRKSMYA